MDAADIGQRVDDLDALPCVMEASEVTAPFHNTPLAGLQRLEWPYVFAETG